MKSNLDTPDRLAFQPLESISREPSPSPNLGPSAEDEMADSGQAGLAGNTGTQMIVISPVSKKEEEDYVLSSPEPVPSDARKETEEKRDSLYNILAPKQAIGDSMEEVVNAIPDQSNIISIHSPDDSGSAPPAFDNHLSMEENPHAHMKSTLKKSQQAWVDPWEAAIQDTFYHKEISNLRPTFEIVNDSIKGPGQRLQHLFHAPAQIQEDESTNQDELELEEEEKRMEETTGISMFHRTPYSDTYFLIICFVYYNISMLCVQ